MKHLGLIVFNAGAVVAAIVSLFFAWFFLPHEMFAWNIILAILILSFAAYVDLRFVASAIIEARRKASGKTGPRPRSMWLTITNYVSVVIILSFVAFTWFYLPQEIFTWSMWIAEFMFLLIFLLNGLKLATDYVDSGKTSA